VINRVLIVGYGSIGKRHLRLARELLPNADIRVLRHQQGIQTPEFANGLFSNIQEAINFFPQIAVVANPATYHVAVAQALAERGVHLLIEKPLSHSTIGVNQLIKTCKTSGSVLLVGYNLRFFPSLQRYRTLLSQGVIGKVISVRCEIGQYLPSWRPEVNYRLSVSARHELGGGVLLELSHEIDYLRWIFGEVNWVNATLGHHSSLEVDVEDTAHITIGFFPKDERRSLIGTVNMDFIRHDTTRLCTAIGENGSLSWNGLTGKVMAYMAGENEWCELFHDQTQRDYSYLAQWREFVACVTEKKTPLIAAEDGLKVLEIIEAVRNSAVTGCRVSILEKIQKDNIFK
jgi:predicted dehydrogenase